MKNQHKKKANIIRLYHEQFVEDARAEISGEDELILNIYKKQIF